MKKKFISRVFNETRTVKDADIAVRLALGLGFDDNAANILHRWDAMICPLLDAGLSLQQITKNLQMHYPHIAEIARILDEHYTFN